MTFSTETTHSSMDTKPKEDKVPLDKDPKMDKKQAAELAWAKLKENLPQTKPWKEKTTSEKFETVAWGIAKGCTLLLLLYLFVCSLDLLSSSFQLLGGRTTGEIFGHPLLANPIVGLMIGVLVTVLVQSSSTSTSIVVSLVAAGLEKDRNFPTIEIAIPIIMGANVGTSVTNTIVAITRIGDRAEFGRAFAGATVHDMFNWLTVIILLTLEVTTGYLYWLTSLIMDSMNLVAEGGEELKLLKAITEPFTKAIVLLDKEVLTGWAMGDPAYDNATLLKIWCEPDVKCKSKDCKSKSICSYMALSDRTTGAIMTVVSLVMLCGCLILMVKLLQNVLQGSMARVVQKIVNADIPYVPWLTGYLAILVGAVCTFLMQSSSVFTSALTPLVGMGIITVSRVYPLTLGSNIGTTTTAILAALTAPAETLRESLQIAFCHLFFNITGILIFYPLPFMRWPLPLARLLGRTTAQFRWFAIAYLITSFILIPVIVLSLSLVNYLLLAVGIPVTIIIAFVVVVNLMQKRFPKYLPSVLRTWNWLPLWMHSLEPIDRLFTGISVKCFKYCKCCKCCKLSDQSDESDDDDVEKQIEKHGEDNRAFSHMRID
ncbi:hypothetical protein B566_EDAN000958 [Ephemera danica]|nr:hypothetical protein B566_EDAN000958 [Ephemera danica]